MPEYVLDRIVAAAKHSSKYTQVDPQQKENPIKRVIKGLSGGTPITSRLERYNDPNHKLG